MHSGADQWSCERWACEIATACGDIGRVHSVTVGEDGENGATFTP
jgi:hypothetical protein